MRFRLMIGGLAALLAGYALFWFVAAHRFENRILTIIQERRAMGLEITYDDLSVGGFPYRLEALIENVRVSGKAPNGGEALQWSAHTPRFAAVVLPWRPRHAVTFMDEATLELRRAGTSLDRLTAHQVRNSLVVNGSGASERLSMTAASVAAQGKELAGSGFKMEAAEAHWRAAYHAATLPRLFPSEEAALQEPLQWQFAVRAKNIQDPRLAAAPYGPVMESFELVLELHGAGIGPRATTASITAWRDNGGTVDVPSLTLKWGELDVKLSGSVSLDQQFRLLGALTAEVHGYEPVIDKLQRDGNIDAAEAATAKETLRSIADGNDGGRLPVPVTLQGGRMFLGPLPVANLPPLLTPAAEQTPAPGTESTPPPTAASATP